MTVRIINADCRVALRTIPAESVNCIVTSPPYWSLRDYGVEGQIGLEEAPQSFVDEMVLLFRELRRVLRADGTAWVNMGDSYAGSGRGGNSSPKTSTLQGGQASQLASKIRRTRAATEIGGTSRDAAVTNVGRRATRGSQLPPGFHTNAFEAGAIGRAWAPPPFGLKQKDLIGMPWRIAFALQADGWWLRQDIVWNKPNPMPESVTDRCTKAHEYIFLLSKSERYYFDQEAIKEKANYGFPNSPESIASPFGQGYTRRAAAVTEGARPPGTAPQSGMTRRTIGRKGNAKGFRGGSYVNGEPGKRAERGNQPNETMSRNKRSVWTVSTQPFSEAHFATFPPALIEPCILAGCPRGGVVLDPFGGAGTTGLVADRLQRNAVLIELNAEYAAMAQRRIAKEAGLFSSVEVEQWAGA